MLHLLRYTLITVLTVDLLATAGDITMTWSSPVLAKLRQNNSEVNPFGKPITADEESWIGSLVNIGAMIGPFPYGFISAKFGRKISLLCIAIPHIVSYLTFAFSTNIYLYYFGRILGGIAVGGGYTLLPMYIAEVAEDSNRGMYSATFNVFCTFGDLMPYVIGPFISMMWSNVIYTCFPTAFFILFLLVAPESPYYLMMKNKRDRAEQVLMKLRSNDKKAMEDETIYIEEELRKNPETITLGGFIKTKTYVKGLAIAASLLAFQELSGINAIAFYTEDIFEAAEMKSLKPEVCAIIIGSIFFLSSFVTPFVIDNVGRRILLLSTLTGIIISHLGLGIYFYLKSSSNIDVEPISWLPIVSLVLYNMMFSIGLGPVPWTLGSELFPTNVKSYASTCISLSNWTVSFIVTKFFSNMEEGMGVGGTFWFFAGSSCVAWIFTFFIVPETKGKSFQEIQEILKR